MIKAQFDHEKLRVYQDALRFVAFVGPLIAAAGPKAAVRDQLDRASTSIVLNIAEGNGKRSRVDRCRFLDMARGSALESAACLDVCVLKHMATPEQAAEGKALLIGVVSMLVGLLDTFGAELSEPAANYGSPAEHDQEHDQEHESNTSRC